MKLAPVLVTILILAAAPLVACATPRERSQPLPQPDRALERDTSAAGQQLQQSELATLTKDARRAAPAITAADSFRMSGSGDTDAAHQLAAGVYKCSIDLQGNVRDDRPSPFRIHFVSREPLYPALVDTRQSVWTTNFDLLLPGNAQTGSSSVEVRLQAAPASEWTLKCDRRGEVPRSGRGSRTAIQLTLTLNDQPRGNFASSSGRGSGVAMVSAIPDVYTCQISVSGNFAADGGEAQFAVQLDELTLVDVMTTTWDGEVEYELTDRGVGGVPPRLAVTAGDSASWDIACAPKRS